MRRLRPMGIADILDEAVDLYRSNFVLLVGTAAVLLVPWFLFMGFYGNRVEVVEKGASLSNLAIMAPTAIFFLVITPVVTCALAYAISERYLDRRATIGSGYARVMRPGTFLSLLGAIVLKLLVLGLGFFGGGMLAALVTTPFREAGGNSTPVVIAAVALVVVAFAAVALPVWIKLTVVETALIIEGLGAGKAIGRSWSLMKGYFWKALWLTLIVFLVWLILLLILSGPTQWMIMARRLANQPVSQVILTVDLIIETIVRVLLAPVGSTVTILLYYDIRIRKEGFDLEVLASDLDAKARELPVQGVAALPQEHLPPQPPVEGA